MYRCSLLELLDLVLMLQIRQRGGMMTPQAASSASSVQSMQRLGWSMSSSGQRCVSTMACHVAFFGVLTVRTMLDLLVRAATICLFFGTDVHATWFFNFYLHICESLAEYRTFEAMKAPHACRECCRQ